MRIPSAVGYTVVTMLLFAKSGSAEEIKEADTSAPESKPHAGSDEAVDDATTGATDDSASPNETPPEPTGDPATTPPAESADAEPTPGSPADVPVDPPKQTEPARSSYTPPPHPGRAPRIYTGPRKLMLLLGPGFGFSFMYPKAINHYLDEWAARRGVEIEDGTTALFLSLMPRVAITFAPIEYVQIQVVGEIGWAPKVLTTIDGSLDSHTESFHFLRYSTGGTVTGHLPVARGRGSVFIGGGALFNVLKFRRYQELAPGFRGTLGYRIYGRRVFCPEIFFEFNYIKAETGDEQSVYTPDNIDELNYTSGTIGANFYFKVVEK